MTKSDFVIVMDKLAGAYRDDRYNGDSTLKSWFTFFQKFDATVFEDVADAWIVSEPKSPAVSDLHHKCVALQTRLDYDRSKRMVNELADDFLDTEEDMQAHPFEDGWRVNDNGKWVRV